MGFGALGVAAGILCIAAAVWWKVLATRWAQGIINRQRQTPQDQADRTP